MKVIGIVLIVFGVLGLGAGVFGMMQYEKLDAEVTANSERLGEIFPGLPQATSRDVVDMVDMDLALSQLLITAYGPERDAYTEAQTLVQSSMDNMVAMDQMEAAKMIGFPAGGVLLAMGLLFLVLGLRKTSNVPNDVPAIA